MLPRCYSETFQKSCNTSSHDLYSSTMLSSGWITLNITHTDAPDWFLTTTTGDAYCYTITRTGAISTGLVIFAEESRVSLYQFNFIFAGSNNPLAFHQHDETFRHVHIGSMGWPWTSANIRWDQCWIVPILCLCANMRWQLSRVSLGHLCGCLGRYPAPFGPCLQWQST